MPDYSDCSITWLITCYCYFQMTSAMYLGAVLLSAMLTLSTSYPAHIENVVREILTDQCGTFCHHKFKVPKSVTDICTDLCVQLLWSELLEKFMFDRD